MSKVKRIKKNGGIEGVKKRVKHPGTVSVGIIDAGTHVDGDLTVASIGFINEFGTSKIPERSFMRSTTKENKAKIISLQKKLLKQIVLGAMSHDKALSLIGEFVSDLMRQKIVKLRTPENAPATLRAKAPKTNPLINTGQLKNSITYEVNR